MVFQVMQLKVVARSHRELCQVAEAGAPEGICIVGGS